MIWSMVTRSSKLVAPVTEACPMSSIDHFHQLPLPGRSLDGLADLGTAETVKTGCVRLLPAQDCFGERGERQPMGLGRRVTVGGFACIGEDRQLTVTA